MDLTSVIVSIERGRTLKAKRLYKVMALNILGDAMLWIPVLAATSGVGLLLEAIIDTIRYGHPR